ncbi:MAG: hypothetical protein AABY55_01505 [Candidatus Omnitrophota bacterium]
MTNITNAITKNMYTIVMSVFQAMARRMITVKRREMPLEVSIY